jgi:hypothetical protein
MSAGPPNLVLVVLDCVRAKSLRFGGARRPAHTPELDSLGRDGLVFDHAVAPANWTVPSHWSMFTGVYPVVHGVRQASQAPRSFESVSSRLVERGYETALFTEQEFLVAGLGLEAGYGFRAGPEAGEGAVTEERSKRPGSLRGTDLLYSSPALRLFRAVPPAMVPFNVIDHRVQAAYKARLCGPEVIHRFEEWVRQRDRSRPFHAFVNFVDAHEPYSLVDPTDEAGVLARWYARTPRNFLLLLPELRDRVPWPLLENEYRRAIESADRKVGRLVRALKEANELDHTFVVVTADHGQAFGESGTVFHGNGVTEAVTRVPLIVRPPVEVSLPPRVSEWTSLCALARWFEALARGRPTAEALELPSTPDVGPSSPTVVYCDGSPASDFGKILRGRASEAGWNHRLLAAYQGRSKWVWDVDSGEMFWWKGDGAIADDLRGETVVGSEAHRVRTEIFDPYLRLAPTSPAPTPARAENTRDDVAARLRSWGYDG